MRYFSTILFSQHCCAFHEANLLYFLYRHFIFESFYYLTQSWRWNICVCICLVIWQMKVSLWKFFVIFFVIFRMEVMKLFCLLVFAEAMSFKERFLKMAHSYESYHIDSYGMTHTVWFKPYGLISYGPYHMAPYHMAHMIWVIWGQGSRTHYQKELNFSSNHWVRRTGFRRKVVIILNTAI